MVWKTLLSAAIVIWSDSVSVPALLFAVSVMSVNPESRGVPRRTPVVALRVNQEGNVLVLKAAALLLAVIV